MKRILIFSACIIIMIGNRPDFLFHPKFWAEDTWIFSPQHSSIVAFITPYAGYQQFVPRVIATLTNSPTVYAWISFIASAFVLVSDNTDW